MRIPRSSSKIAIALLMLSAGTQASATILTFDGWLVEQTRQTGTSGNQFRQQSAPWTMTYDTAAGVYLVKQLDGTQIDFSYDEILFGQSTPSYDFYRDTTTGMTLKLLNQSASNPLIHLSHVTYGTWGRPIQPTEGYSSARQQTFMVFGNATALAAIPRTGSATYSAILDGDYSDRFGNYTLSGTAGLTADFASGGLSMFINPQGTNVATGSVVNFGGFRGAGAIDYSTGIFSGSDASPNYSFSYRGSFFGPSANEVGGHFSLNTIYELGAGGGGGIFVGKQGALPAAQPEPVPPPPPVATGPASLSIERTWNGSGGSTSSPAGATIIYDPASASYLVKERDGTAFTFTADERVAADSTATISAFRDSQSGTTFRHLNGSDPAVALTYVTYGSWRRPVTVNGTTSEKITHVVYGTPTAVNAMPRTGTATYNARLDGTMSSGSGLHALGGTAQFSANFGSSRMSYTLNPVATINGQAVSFNNVTGSGSIVGATFNGRSITSIPSYSTVSGGFFGPQAQEIGGTFTFSSSTGFGGPVSGIGAGVFVGKQ